MFLSCIDLKDLNFSFLRVIIIKGCVAWTFFSLTLQERHDCIWLMMFLPMRRHISSSTKKMDGSIMILLKIFIIFSPFIFRETVRFSETVLSTRSTTTSRFYGKSIIIHMACQTSCKNATNNHSFWNQSGIPQLTSCRRQC
jgi:hypothetical protein